MADDFTKVTTNSWSSRIKGSLSGVLFGFLVLAGASFLIYWNEGRTIKTERALEEGAAIVVSVNTAQVDPDNAGNLVHFSGDTSTTETLSDPDFAMSLNAIKLRRKVDMYQWHERRSSRTEKLLGGSTRTVTTYSYDKRWSNSPVSSSHFEHPKDHANPGAFRFRQFEQVARNITVGAFTISRGLVSKLNDFQPLPLDEQMRLKLSPELKNTLKLLDSSYYLGKNPGSPEIGDTKITFEAVKPGHVTVVAKQVGNTVEPYSTSGGNQLEILMSGEHSAREVFKAKEKENLLWGWGLRAAGLFLLFVGFSLLMRPAVVLADVVPIFGSLVEIGTSFIAAVLAVVSFAIVFAVSWFRFRPTLAVLVAGGAVGVIIFLKNIRDRRNAATSG